MRAGAVSRMGNCCFESSSRRSVGMISLPGQSVFPARNPRGGRGLPAQSRISSDSIYDPGRRARRQLTRSPARTFVSGQGFRGLSVSDSGFAEFEHPPWHAPLRLNLGVGRRVPQDTTYLLAAQNNLNFPVGFSHIIEFSGPEERVTGSSHLVRVADCLHSGAQLGFGAA